MEERNLEKTLSEVLEWASKESSSITLRSEYARGFKDGYDTARDIVNDIVNETLTKDGVKNEKEEVV